MLEGERFVVGEEDSSTDGSLHLFEHTAVVGVEDACHHLSLLDMWSGTSHAIEDASTTGNDVHKLILV